MPPSQRFEKRMTRVTPVEDGEGRFRHVGLQSDKLPSHVERLKTVALAMRGILFGQFSKIGYILDEDIFAGASNT